MLVPKSLDPDVRAARLPVPDPRPSEKIARLFPQAPAAKPVVSAATSGKDETVAVASPVPLPAPRPVIEPVREPRRHMKTRSHQQ
jgi:membrane-bound lytic murein transglycosylase A